MTSESSRPASSDQTSEVRHGERSELGSRDIDYTTRGARVRERDAIESIRPSIHIFMPRDTPRANIIECRELGAHVTLIDGLITDCGAEIARRKDAEGWLDMSTLKEPYRVEGKKTLGYELAEQLNWQLPDVILYPTGGGTG